MRVEAKNPGVNKQRSAQGQTGRTQAPVQWPWLGTGDWIPHLSVNQEAGQREKPRDKGLHLGDMECRVNTTHGQRQGTSDRTRVDYL